MQTVTRENLPSNVLVRWILHRSGHFAQCVLHTVGDRLELHIQMTDEVVLSQQCRGPEDAYALSSAWWAALVERGWTEMPHDVRVVPKADRRACIPPRDNRD